MCKQNHVMEAVLPKERKREEEWERGRRKGVQGERREGAGVFLPQPGVV